jgi:hypothetical protein
MYLYVLSDASAISHWTFSAIKVQEQRSGLMFVFDQDKTEIESVDGQKNILREVQVFTVHCIWNAAWLFDNIH